MYNEALKKQYISTEDSQQYQAALTRYFMRIASKEKEYGKDLVEMNLEQLLDTLKSLDVRREATRGHLISLLRGYYNWVKLNRKDIEVDDALSSIMPSSIGSDDTVKNSMIKDPEHLKSILDNGLDRDYENKSMVTELLFWLVYCGIDFEKIPALEKNNINYETNIVRVTDEISCEITDEIAALWNVVAELTYIEKRNGKAASAKNRPSTEFSKVALMNNNYLFRPIVGNKGDSRTQASPNWLRKLHSGVFEYSDTKIIPFRNIKYSGIFHKLYLLEKAGNVISNELLADSFSLSYNKQSELLSKARKWRTDYQDWKIAFALE